MLIKQPQSGADMAKNHANAKSPGNQFNAGSGALQGKFQGWTQGPGLITGGRFCRGGFYHD